MIHLNIFWWWVYFRQPSFVWICILNICFKSDSHLLIGSHLFIQSKQSADVLKDKAVRFGKRYFIRVCLTLVLWQGKASNLMEVSFGDAYGWIVKCSISKSLELLGLPCDCRTQVLGSSSTAFPGTRAENWLGGGSVDTWTCTPSIAGRGLGCYASPVALTEFVFCACLGLVYGKIPWWFGSSDIVFMGNHSSNPKLAHFLNIVGRLVSQTALGSGKVCLGCR